jgi:hypothetical protein
MSAEARLKYLTSAIEAVGGWLRYQDGKATALSAIVGVGLLDSIRLTETSAFAEADAPWHEPVFWLFWVSLVTASVSILLFALAIFPNARKPKSGKNRAPRSLYYWRYVATLDAETLANAAGQDDEGMCIDAAYEARGLAKTLLVKMRLVQGGWVVGLLFVGAWATARVFASI